MVTQEIYFRLKKLALIRITVQVRFLKRLHNSIYVFNVFGSVATVMTDISHAKSIYLKNIGHNHGNTSVQQLYQTI